MIVIPDIHGRTFWKDALEGREEERIIFLGDYTDPYPSEGVEYWQGLVALREVLEFKKKHQDNVVLLLGNHDLSYVNSVFYKCRHDYENHDEIKALLTENLTLFNIAHEEVVGGRRIVFSHAGILPAWLKENEGLLGMVRNGDEVARLNYLFHYGDIHFALNDVSFHRGGRMAAGSCVWADVDEFDASSSLLPDCYQVFGHSQMCAPKVTDDFACLDCRHAFQMDETLSFTML